MWVLRDRNKQQQLNNSIRGEHQVAVRVTFLDQNFDKISSDAELSNCDCKTGSITNISNFVSDGNVDVDVTRLIRRTAELTLLNPTKKFSPRKIKDVEDSLAGFVYLNRYVRIERGVHIGSDTHIYVPIGTFMIDICDITVERNMSVVTLTLSDLAKKLTKSVIGSSSKKAVGTTYNSIIRELTEDAGISYNDNAPMKPILDDLSSRSSSEKQLNHILKFERGDNRGDKLKELCDKWDIDAYFDPMGRFITEDRRDPKGKKPVWEFYNSDKNDGMLISLKRTLSDDKIYNHVIVIGTGDEKNPVRASRKNNNNTSYMSVGNIGDRVKYIETSRVSTQAEADRVLDRAWKRRYHLEETIDVECVCVPSLEGNDIITIREDEHAFIQGDKNNGKTYRLMRFNIPLSTSVQKLYAADEVTPDEI